MKKILSLLALVCLSCMGAWADDWAVNIPDGTVSVSSTKANTVVAATSADDNSHWYVMQQTRGRLTPVVAPSNTDGAINRESNALSSYITNGSTSTGNAKKYLVRLVPSGTNNIYYIQFGTGLYFGHTAATLTLNSGSGTALNARIYDNADKYFVYNIASNDTHIGISYTADNSAHTARVDNNGNGSGLSYWTSGQLNSIDGNDDWSFYPVEFDFTVQTAQLTYKYTNDGQTWYTESAKTVTVGQPYPELTLPYGVIGTKPAGNVPSGDATIEIPVTYTKGTRGFDFSADYEHAKWHKWYKRYSWQNTVRSELFYVEEANYINQNKDNTNNTSDEYLWAAVGNPFDFVIINRAAGNGKYLSNPNTTVGDANEPYMQEESSKTQHYYLYNCTNENNTWGDMNFCIINASTRTTLSGNGHLNYWVNNNAWGDDGSRMIWEWVMNEPEGIPVTFNYTSSQGASWSIEKRIEIGHSLEESDYAVDFYNNYSVSPNTPVSSTNTTFNITCDDNFPFAVGQPCRINSVLKNHDLYVKSGSETFTYTGTSTGESLNGDIAYYEGEMPANSNLWIFEHVANSQDAFLVKNYLTGKYLTFQYVNGGRCIAFMEDAPFTGMTADRTSYMRVRKSIASNKGENGFVLQHPKYEGLCCSVHIGNGTTEPKIVSSWKAGDESAAFSNDTNTLCILAPETYSANLAAAATEGNYGSIYLPYTMTLPEGVEAYAAAKDGEVLTLTKVGETGAVIPEGAYILYSESATSANLTLGETATANADGNELTGKFEANVTLPTGSNYVLNDKNSVVGFYKYTKTTYPVAKAVFCAGESSSNAFSFRFDDVVTAIDAIHSNNSNAEIFDLQGRRLVKAQQGMNIINGHKVLVK